jgi:hypothetical protein
MQPLLVRPEHVDIVWEDASALLSRVENYRSDVADLYPLVKAGDRQLWISFNDKVLAAACITNIVQYPKCKAIMVTTLGGDGGDWDTMLKTLERYGTSMGCDRMEVIGRRGWLRALKGFTDESATFSKPIGEE